MQVNDRSIGRCPACDLPIPDAFVLIEYDTDHGRSRYAECPNCRDVVRPMVDA